MPPLDDYLRSIEARLRCPANRRPEIVEELRGHIRDRAEALMAQTPHPCQYHAERMAVREMGPAWLLALRLSAANGWSVTAHVLRELWAMGLAMEVSCVAAFIAFAVTPRLAEEMIPATRPLIWAPYLLLLAGFSTLGLAFGSIVRGWLWAVVPALVVANMGRAFHDARFFVVSFVISAVFLAAVASGLTRKLPRRRLLACAGVVLIGVGALASLLAVPEVGLRELPGALASIFPVRDAAGGWSAFDLLLVPWLLLFGAWLIERAVRASASEIA